MIFFRLYTFPMLTLFLSIKHFEDVLGIKFKPSFWCKSGEISNWKIVF